MTFQERRLWDFSELVWRWELLIYFENTILRGMWEILLWTSALGLEAFNVMMQRCIFNHCFKLAFSNPVQLPDNNCCFLYWCISLSEVTFFSLWASYLFLASISTYIPRMKGKMSCCTPLRLRDLGWLWTFALTRDSVSRMIPFSLSNLIWQERSVVMRYFLTQKLWYNHVPVAEIVARILVKSKR